MDNVEECDDNANDQTANEEENIGSTIHRGFSTNCHATGVYIDLMRRPIRRERNEEIIVSERSTFDDINNEESIRAPSEWRDIGTEEEHTITDVQSNLNVASPVLEPRIEILTNQTEDVQAEAPPSYTSLPSSLPCIDLPSVIHPLPPPSYEQTFGLRYLERDQPVLVFNTENMWGYRPQLAYCLICNAMVLTSVRSEYCHVTHLAALFSFLLCCWPCCVLPYFIPALKEAYHHCPACNRHLGTYHPFSRH